MKNILPAKIICLLVTLLGISFDGVTQGYLKTEGTQIVDEAGEEFILRGIGLGGWMLQEGYMLRTSGPQHEIEAKIEALVGPEKTQEFYDAWLANHMRKIDVDSMAAWGYNSIRLPMHYKLFTPPIQEEPVAGEITWREKGFEMTDQLLEWCKANNMYLILDLHAAPGGQGKNADISDYDDSKPSLWESEANRAKTVALWKKLAERYADEPMIGGYDLINEPNWGFQNIASDPNGCAENQNTILWQLQKDITAAIREVDQNHIIIIEGNCWGNNYSGLPELWDDNLVISFHKYWNANTQNAIQGLVNLRNERNVPLYLGESGENSNTWFTDAISLAEENGIGWAWWPLKKMGSNNALEIKVNPGYQDILDYWNGNGEKPSEAVAFESLMQLTENLKLENNIYHRDVVDAMIRQPHSEEAIPFKDIEITAEGSTIIYATDYDLGRHLVAYHDNEVANTTGNAGGQAWNQGYSYRNDGVDIQPSEDETINGYNVGWTANGEWMQYTVTVETEGMYTLNIRTASTTDAGKTSISANGEKITKSVSLPNTGGYQIWESTEVKDVYLKAGVNVLRITIDNEGFNLNYLEFTKQDGASSEQPELLDGSIYKPENVINLVYNQPFNAIPEDPDFSVTVNGTAAAVGSVSLKEGFNQVIQINLTETVKFGDSVLVSYAGASVTTNTDIALSAFSDAFITIETDYKVSSIPGRVRAEDFTVNSGFEWETTTDTGGGLNAGYTDNGDFLDFVVMVEKEGYYRADFRVASLNDGGTLKLQTVEENGTRQDLSTVNFNVTGGWQTWVTSRGSNLFLEPRVHTLRLMAASSMFNINWFELSFISEEDPDVEEPLGVNDSKFEEGFSIFPNPTKDSFNVQFSDEKKVPQELFVFDLSGKMLVSIVTNNVSEINIDHKLKKGMCFIVFELDGKKVARKLLIN